MCSYIRWHAECNSTARAAQGRPESDQTMTSKTYQSNGSDGYSEGTWGYIINADDGSIWCDGGFASRQLARAACAKRMRRI
jgi:hypothetical protein